MGSRFTKSTIAVLVLGGIGMVFEVGGFLLRGAQSQQTEAPQVPGYSGFLEMNENRRIMRAEAERRFVRAKQKVEYGDAEAQFELGNCYRAGAVAAEDQVEAVNWFRKSADQNNLLAQHELGLSYRDGRGVAKDFAEAGKWFRRAAEGNLSAAQFRLGDCYANGQGVARDEVEADAWYLAAQHGSKWSTFCRDELEKRLSPRQIADARKRAEELRAQIDAKTKSIRKRSQHRVHDRMNSQHVRPQFLISLVLAGVALWILYIGFGYTNWATPALSRAFGAWHANPTPETRAELEGQKQIIKMRQNRALAVDLGGLLLVAFMVLEFLTPYCNSAISSADFSAPCAL